MPRNPPSAYRKWLRYCIYPSFFCECLQVLIHKDDTDLVYKISPILSESHEAVGRWPGGEERT